MKLYLLILSIGLVALGCGKQDRPQVKKSENVSSLWNASFIEGNYSSIQEINGGILLVNTQVGTQLKLNIGESIEYPDHHSKRKITLWKTDLEGAYFIYESSFDHRSFGKNLIEEDKGEFLVPWKTP